MQNLVSVITSDFPIYMQIEPVMHPTIALDVDDE